PRALRIARLAQNTALLALRIALLAQNTAPLAHRTALLAHRTAPLAQNTARLAHRTARLAQHILRRALHPVLRPAPLQVRADPLRVLLRVPVVPVHFHQGVKATFSYEIGFNPTDLLGRVNILVCYRS
ncbi:MAG: hypothetical protein ACKODJ_09440, partial [Bacteroidota bacterium]